MNSLQHIDDKPSAAKSARAVATSARTAKTAERAAAGGDAIRSMIQKREAGSGKRRNVPDSRRSRRNARQTQAKQREAEARAKQQREAEEKKALERAAVQRLAQKSGRGRGISI